MFVTPYHVGGDRVWAEVPEGECRAVRRGVRVLGDVGLFLDLNAVFLHRGPGSGDGGEVVELGKSCLDWEAKPFLKGA